MEEKYLQLQEDLEESDLAQFENVTSHIDDPFLTPDDKKDSQLRLINHEYQKKDKLRMIFNIEEVRHEDSIQSYESNCIFDEMLEFYAFMNVWAVEENEMADQVENYYYKHDKAIDHSDELQDKVEKVLFILNNVEQRIKFVENDTDMLQKCKTQLSQQGILDLLCRVLDIIYYKTTPPPMFHKPFKSNKNKTNQEKEEEAKRQDAGQKGGDDEFAIDDYMAQEIARESLKDVLLKIMQLLVHLVRGHRTNSEHTTKYFNSLYQHMHV